MAKKKNKTSKKHHYKKKLLVRSLIAILILAGIIGLIIYIVTQSSTQSPTPTPGPQPAPAPSPGPQPGPQPGPPVPGPQPGPQPGPHPGCCYWPYADPAAPTVFPRGVCVLNKSRTDCSLVQNQTDCKNVGWPDATFLPQAFDSEKIWTYGTQPPNLCLTMPIANGYPCHDLQPCPNVGYTQAKSKQDCIDHVQNLPKPKPVAWYVPPDVPGKSYNCFGDDLAPNGGINLNCIAQDWTPIRVSDGAHAQWCPPRKPPPPRAVGREPPPM